jgi:phage-related protein
LTVLYHTAALKELKGLNEGAGAGLQATMDDVSDGTVLPRRRERLTDDLWEAKLPRNGNQYRLIYAALDATESGPQYLGLLAFQKKTKKTPRQHINTARTRLADWHAK